MAKEQTLAAQGFTLIELLVVIIIITIVSTVALLSISQIGEVHQAEQTAKKLKVILGYLQQQALAEATPYALGLTQQGIMVYRLQTDQWQKVSLPQQLLLHSSHTVQLDIAPTTDINPIQDVKVNSKGIIMTADGALNAYTITIKNRQQQPLYSVSSDMQTIRISKAN